MILADATTNWTLGCSIFLAAVTLAAQITLWLTMKAPQKREVFFSGNPVDRKDFDAHLLTDAAEHMNLSRQITEAATLALAARTADAAESKKDRGELYAHIDKVRLELKADINSSNDNTNSRINEVLMAVSEVRGELKAK